MLLKRKRSDDELSTFGGGGGIGYSSPMRSDSGDIVMMDTDSPISPPGSILSPTAQNQSRSRSCTPSHLPSRTFKRHRNGRPSDQEVHQNTLKMLYQAQQQPQQPQSPFSPPISTVSMPSMPAPFQASPTQSQPSLHSFWRIPTPQPSPLLSAPSVASTRSIGSVNRPTMCEDCGVALNEEDAMMDDGYGFETYINACSACSKAVCFSCSVSNLGEQRRCLRCAGSDNAVTTKDKKWVGGLSDWVSGGVAAH